MKIQNYPILPSETLATPYDETSYSNHCPALICDFPSPATALAYLTKISQLPWFLRM